ncbi:MAG: cell division FtsA domain-containing protein [Bacilli bacterium]
MRQIFTSIDIGTNAIKLVVCEIVDNNKNILVALKEKNKGMRKGLIVDADLVYESLKIIINKANKILGTTIENVIVNAPIKNSKFIRNSATNAIIGQENIVTSNDVNRLFKEITYRTIQDEDVEEILNIIPIKFLVDGKSYYNSPVGLKCQQLTLEANLLIVPSKNINSVIQIFEQLNIDVVSISSIEVGNYYRVKECFEIDGKNGLIIDIGYEKTTVSFYEKGILDKIDIINLGSRTINNDITYMYKLSEEEAESLRIKKGTCHKRLVATSEIIINENGNAIDATELSMVISERIKEIIEISRNAGKLISKEELNFLVLTGGITESYGFDLMIEEMFIKNLLLLKTDIIGARSNEYSGVLGMIDHFYNELLITKNSYSGISAMKIEEMLSKTQTLENTSIVDRMFNYFAEK